MELLTRMVEHHIWFVSEMLTRAERLPDDVLDRPIEISVDGVDRDPTLRSLLARPSGRWRCGMRRPTASRTTMGSPISATATRCAGLPSLPERAAAL